MARNDPFSRWIASRNVDAWGMPAIGHLPRWERRLLWGTLGGGFLPAAAFLAIHAFLFASVGGVVEREAGEPPTHYVETYRGPKHGAPRYPFAAKGRVVSVEVAGNRTTTILAEPDGVLTRDLVPWRYWAVQEGARHLVLPLLAGLGASMAAAVAMGVAAGRRPERP